jgi:plastocyanin
MLAVLAITVAFVSCGKSHTTAAKCTAGNAKAARSVTVSSSKFTIPCAKAKQGSQFLFIDLDPIRHSITTARGAPAAVDATLEGVNSTLPYTLTAKGTYRFRCKFHGEEMTLIVE